MKESNNDIIILGCQRAGKTTLAKLISDEKNCSIISVDSLIYSFQEIFPELNIDRKTKIIEKSKKLTPFVSKYLESFKKDYPNKMCIVEACQLLPLDVKKQKRICKNQIICLGFPNASEDEIFNNIREYDLNINSYTKKMSDDELKENIKYWIKYSKTLKLQAEKLGIPFYETDKNREKVINEIINDIEKKQNKYIERLN